MGALDVCPFIPVANVTMEECVKCSQQFGEQLANMLNVPVYLYEYSSSRDYRKSLSQIREGEYEGLEKKVLTLFITILIVFVFFSSLSLSGPQTMAHHSLFHDGVLLLLVHVNIL